MDDGADVWRLRTEDLCGLNTFMNTVNSQKFQLFGNPESFMSIPRQIEHGFRRN